MMQTSECENPWSTVAFGWVRDLHRLKPVHQMDYVIIVWAH